MHYRSIIRLLPLVSMMGCLAVSGAYAGIGGIGSPVVPSNLPAAPNTITTDVLPASSPEAATASPNVAATPAPVAATAARSPLLVIRFNQSHVYFDRALSQAVELSEKTKPDASYDVVSVIPAGGRSVDKEHIAAKADGNVQAVVSSMQNLGVPGARIHTSTQNSGTATSQEIQIFVN